MPSILLRNATVLTHAPLTANGGDGDGQYRVIPLWRHSVLICNALIARITPDIEPPNADTKVIDCTDKIVSPGFVDTHHHLWQTQSKGRHANELLLDYLGTGSLSGASFAARDLFWGQLAGSLEAIDGGTTTVVDHASGNFTPAHADAAIAATVSAGIRSIYAYSPTKRLKSWDPFEWDDELLPDWVMRQLEHLAHKQPFGEGRVRLGFGFDGYYLPKETVVDLFNRVRGLGIKLITSHYTNTPIYGGYSVPSLLAEYGLLKNDILLSHANQADAKDMALLREHGGFVSSTPDTELQFGLGLPVCFHPRLHSISSLGADCHSNNSADILSAMRLGLQTSRGVSNQRFLSHAEMMTTTAAADDIPCRANISWVPQMKNPKKTKATVEQAFNLGTILGAQAIGLGDQIGSLAVGKQADLVIFNGTSPAMLCAADHDPVAAIVQHASVRDIEHVIVAGDLLKESGHLRSPIRIDDVTTTAITNLAELGAGIGPVDLSWPDIVRETRRSRERLNARWAQVDFGAHGTVRRELIKALRIDEGKLADDI